MSRELFWLLHSHSRWVLQPLIVPQRMSKWGRQAARGRQNLGLRKLQHLVKVNTKDRERTKNETYFGPVWTRHWGHSVAAAR